MKDKFSIKRSVFAACFVLGLSAVPTKAETVCTIVVDMAGFEKIHESGDCDRRTTPASTFKVALALIGYDSGVLKSASKPKLPFREGYLDWRGEVWRQATTPLRWMKYSVVWYSQQIAKQMGMEAITGYLKKLDYGNADFSGDKGYDNGLERAWLSSSLEISPSEQLRFLARMLNYQLPVSRNAVDNTKAITETFVPGGGWRVQGKTGLAFPRRADRSFDRARGVGWFVGWAVKEGRSLVFVRRIQDSKRQATHPSTRAKNSMLEDLPKLANK